MHRQLILVALACGLLLAATTTAQPAPAPASDDEIEAPAPGGDDGADDGSDDAAETARWCTSDANETAVCEQAVTRMNALSLGFNFSCYEAPEQEEGDACADAIAANEADFAAFGASGMYFGYTEHNMQAILSTNVGPTQDASYYAIALVKREVCTANFNLESLKGFSSCHTGFGRTAGWQMPIGNMINSGIIPLINEDPAIANDAESVAAWFSGGSCAVASPRNSPVVDFEGTDASEAQYEPLCEACNLPSNCSTADIWWDYPGVVRGVMEDGCQVGFTKHDVMLEVVGDGTAPESWSTLNKADLRLVCEEGCAPVDDWATCNVARVPLAAVMVRGNYAGVAALQGALSEAVDDRQIQALVVGEEANPEGYLFNNEIQGLDPIEGDTQTYLGTSATGYEGMAQSRLDSNAVPAGAPVSDDDTPAAEGPASDDDTTAPDEAPAPSDDDQSAGQTTVGAALLAVAAVAAVLA